MGDSAQAWVTVLACPERLEEAVLGVFAARDLGISWADVEYPNDLQFGELYTSAGTDLTWCDEIMVDLGLVSDQITAWAGQAAYGEYSAAVSMMVPGLGVWSGDGSDTGEPHVPASTITSVIAEVQAFDLDAIVASLNDLSADLVHDVPSPERLASKPPGCSIDGERLVTRLRSVGGIAHYEAIQAMQKETATA